jgi:hypothetical protein
MRSASTISPTTDVMRAAAAVLALPDLVPVAERN